MRISYAGELGWELHIPFDQALQVWDTLWQAGREFDMISAGQGCFDSLRLEKGYRLWGGDIYTEYNPYETGMAWTVRLNKKEDFATLAKTYSDDSGSALQGGSLGWVNPGTMVGEFEKVMNTQAMHTVSEPFRSQFGWHILEVTDRRNQDMSTEFKRNRARQMLSKRKFDEDLATWLREIRQDAYVEVKL